VIASVSQMHMLIIWPICVLQPALLGSLLIIEQVNAREIALECLLIIRQEDVFITVQVLRDFTLIPQQVLVYICVL